MLPSSMPPISAAAASCIVRDAAGGLLKPVKEGFSDAVGVATLKLRPTAKLADYKGRVMLFVRARKSDGQVIGQHHGTTLVSVKLRALRWLPLAG